MASDLGDRAIAGESVSTVLLDRKRRSPGEGRKGGFHQPRPELHRIRLNSQLRAKRTVLRFVSPVLFKGSPPQPLGSALSRFFEKVKGGVWHLLDTSAASALTPSATERSSIGVLRPVSFTRVRPVCRYSAAGTDSLSYDYSTAREDCSGRAARRRYQREEEDDEEGGGPLLASALSRAFSPPHTVC